MTLNETLNKLFDDAEKRGYVKKLNNSQMLTNTLKKINRKEGVKSLGISIVLSILSIVYEHVSIKDIYI